MGNKKKKNLLLIWYIFFTAEYKSWIGLNSIMISKDMSVSVFIYNILIYYVRVCVSVLHARIFLHSKAHWWFFASQWFQRPRDSTSALSNFAANGSRLCSHQMSWHFCSELNNTCSCAPITICVLFHYINLKIV